MIPIKAILFDFDGVLADTEPFHWKAWCEVLAPYSPDLTWDAYLRLCVGTSDLQMLQFFSEITRKPATVDELRALYPKKRKIFEALAAARPIIDADLVRLLASLKGPLLGVVTSSNQLEVEPILRREGLLGLLGTVIYGNDVTHHKPHPQPYQLALERLSVEPGEVTVFEDSASGIRSASEAGCHVVTVPAPADLRALVETELAARWSLVE